MFAGARVFDVKIQGATVLDNYDIFAAVGENAAAMETFATTVSNDVLTIQFLAEVENPKVTARHHNHCYHCPSGELTL